MGASTFCPVFFYNIRLVWYFFKEKRKEKGKEVKGMWASRNQIYGMRGETKSILSSTWLSKQTQVTRMWQDASCKPRTRGCRFMTVLFSGCHWQVGTHDGDVTLVVPSSFGGQNSLSFFFGFYFKKKYFNGYFITN